MTNRVGILRTPMILPHKCRRCHKWQRPGEWMTISEYNEEHKYRIQVEAGLCWGCAEEREKELRLEIANKEWHKEENIDG